jgi:hypothetical protein
MCVYQLLTQRNEFHSIKTIKMNFPFANGCKRFYMIVNS